jgi:DNA-binding LytR/AlgR family response regulator
MSQTLWSVLIAEDEPLLALELQNELTLAWPGAQVLKTVGDGASAVQQALALLPDVLFFDIRMPGMSGLDAAAELADQWPDHAPAGRAFPLLVFVTAYDQYAVQAFEAQAVDYLLKPVQPERLQKTVAKLQLALAKPAQAAINFEATLDQLRSLMLGGVGERSNSMGAAQAPVLTTIAASVGSTIHMVPVAEVQYFEAADKYVRVMTQDREYLIRTPLKELLPQLSSGMFQQVHRGTVVNTACIATVTRDEAGRLHLALRNRSEKLAVSRIYAHVFKAM